MAFLGSVGKFIQHVAKEPVVRVLFPAAIATDVARGIGHGLSNTAEKLLAGHHGQTQENAYVQVQSPYQGYSPYSVQPSGFSDYGQGAGFAPPYYSTPEPSYNYEVPPWDYSTSSEPATQIRLMPPVSQTVFFPSQNKTSGVEDLLAAALPLFL